MVDTWYIGMAVTGLGMAVLHWFPWPRKLRRLEAYALGTGSVLLGQFLWLGWCDTFLLLAAFPLAAGIVTALGWWYDRYANLSQRVKLHERD